MVTTGAGPQAARAASITAAPTTTILTRTDQRYSSHEGPGRRIRPAHRRCGPRPGRLTSVVTRRDGTATLSRRAGMARTLGLDLIGPLLVFQICRRAGLSEVWSLVVAGLPDGTMADLGGAVRLDVPLGMRLRAENQRGTTKDADPGA